jgi:hypothetical protein
MSQEQSNKPQERSIVEFAQGAIMERIDIETSRILENIQDMNTRATAKRTLTVKIEFVPAEDRQSIVTKAVASSKIEPLGHISSQLYMVPDGNGEPCWVEATPQIPGQQAFGGAEQAAPNMLKFQTKGVA